MIGTVRQTRRGVATTPELAGLSYPSLLSEGEGWLAPPQWCRRRQMELASVARLRDPTFGPGVQTSYIVAEQHTRPGMHGPVNPPEWLLECWAQRCLTGLDGQPTFPVSDR